MNDRVAVRNWRGEILGFIIDQENGNQLATNFYGQQIGIYKKDLNITTTWRGVEYGKGNQLSALIVAASEGQDWLFK